jgi:alpha-1,6-mannosyltransferase
MLAVRSSRRIVEHERPDVIEVGSLGLAPWNIAQASRRLDIPLVAFFHCHFPRLVAGASRLSRVRRACTSLAWRYVKRLDRLYARTVVSSRYAARELQEAGLDRTVYVPLGVDLELFNPARRANREAVRARLGLDDRPLAVYAGRIAAEKQLPVLLHGWRTVTRRTGAVLALVGEGPLKPSLAARFAEPSVRWLPYEPDRGALADLLAAADLVVAPGPIETFGLAALEALACGTPVLAPDRGGGAELVERSAGGARFVSGDAADLAAQAERILDTRGVALGTRGRAYAEREHRWDTVFDAIFRVYDDVVEHRR